MLEAGAGFAGMGSEIAAEITETAFDDLDAPVLRVTGENAPMPYAKNLELLKTPSKAKIAARDPAGVQRMITKVFMPKLSDAMETGKVIKWLKKEGDVIKGGDVLAEVETDKANVEIEAFGSGVLRKIVVEEGGTGAGGRDDRRDRGPAEDIVRAGGRAEAAAPAAAPAAPAPRRVRPSPPPFRAARAPRPGRHRDLRVRPATGRWPSYQSVPATTAVVPMAPAAAAPAPAPVAARAGAPAGGRVKASPLARKIAGQAGVDLAADRRAAGPAAASSAATSRPRKPPAPRPGGRAPAGGRPAPGRRPARGRSS